MPKKTAFNSDWCNSKFHPDWAKWLQPDNDKVNNAKCLVCKKTFSLSNMGCQAIISHEKGPKHQKNFNVVRANQSNLSNFMKSPVTSVTSPTVTEPCLLELDSVDATVKKQNHKETASIHNRGISKYLFNDQVTKAEILWCLRTVVTHSSFRSNSNLTDIFKLMFPDSDIAKKFQLKKDKTAYTICFGLAPFFKSELSAVLSSLENYVICFDEALNKVVQKGQMDIHVRFWKNSTNTVTTRYLTSVFLGHSDAISLMDALKCSIPTPDITKLLQISMDGPNVNHKLHSLLQNDLKENSCSKSLLNIGSCGLHIIHGAFKTGHSATSWNLNKFLYAVFNLFKNSPARRADFIRVTGSDIFPLKFCSIRWVESIVVAQRALDVLPHLRMFVKEIETKKVEPDTATYHVVKNMLKSSIPLEAKLGFFISVASQLQGFLVRFQTDKPMSPFLYEEMYMILHSLMKRFVKNSVIENHNSASKLMKINLNELSNLLSITDVNIGFAAKHSLQKSKIPDAEILNFKKECRSFLQKMTLKLIERNPLRFKLVRGISCLSPSLISTSSSLCVGRLEISLDDFLVSNQIASVTADKVKAEFSKFISSPHVKKEMLDFNYQKDRLDVFYSSLMGSNTNYLNLFAFVKKVLIMSHGNATVESGFSINKAMLIENMQETSVVALRTVYDAVSDAGGFLNLDVSKQMICAARNAHSYYHEELQKKKHIENKSKQVESQKKKAAAEIKEIKAKKMKIQQNADEQIAELNAQIKKLNYCRSIIDSTL